MKCVVEMVEIDYTKSNIACWFIKSLICSEMKKIISSKNKTGRVWHINGCSDGCVCRDGKIKLKSGFQSIKVDVSMSRSGSIRNPVNGRVTNIKCVFTAKGYVEVTGDGVQLLGCRKKDFATIDSAQCRCV